MLIVATDAAQEIQENVDEIHKSVDKLSNLTDGLLNRLIDFGFDILIAIAIFVIGKVILQLVRKFVKRLLSKSSVDVGVEKFVDSLIKFVGYIIILITICGQIGIQTTSFITLLGTAGLSIGLALQGCLANFAGGVLILLSKPFKVGDYILLADVGGNIEGTVEKIDIIHTTLTTIDNKVIQCPNGTVSNSVLINVTNQDVRRVDVEVGIHYEDDMRKAKSIAEQVMNQCPYILNQQDNMVVVKSLGESSVILEIRMWTKSEDYWQGKFYLNEYIKDAFEKNGIRIPYNQLDVHIHQ